MRHQHRGSRETLEETEGKEDDENYTEDSEKGTI